MRRPTSSRTKTSTYQPILLLHGVVIITFIPTFRLGLSIFPGTLLFLFPLSFLVLEMTELAVVAILAAPLRKEAAALARAFCV
jgi:hypothetical protein